MKTQKLSQQVLLELLTREIETLQEAGKEVNRAAPLVKDQLDRLENKQIIAQVNTAPLEAFHQKLDGQLNRGVLMPRWMMGSLIVITIWAVLMTGLNVWFYLSMTEYKEQSQYWVEKAYILEQQLNQPTPPVSKGKSKR